MTGLHFQLLTLFLSSLFKMSFNIIKCDLSWTTQWFLWEAVNQELNMLFLDMANGTQHLDGTTKRFTMASH